VEEIRQRASLENDIVAVVVAMQKLLHVSIALHIAVIPRARPQFLLPARALWSATEPPQIPGDPLNYRTLQIVKLVY